LEYPDINYHSYTFFVTNTPENGGMENLFLSLQSDGSYKEFLVKYSITDAEIELMKQKEYVNLEDKVSIAELTGRVYYDGNTDCWVNSSLIEVGCCDVGNHMPGEACPWINDSNCAAYSFYHTYNITCNQIGGGDDGGASNPPDPNGNGNGGTDGNNHFDESAAVVCNPRDPLCFVAPTDNCDELMADSIDPDFINAVEDLYAKSLSENKEVGYYKKPKISGIGNDFVYYDVADANTNLLDWTIPAGTDIRGMYHTHYDIITQLPVFSPDDLYTLFKLFGPQFDTMGNVTFTNNIHRSMTFILVTAHGTKLALKFEDTASIDKFRLFGQKYFEDWDTNYTPVAGIDYESDRDKLMANYDRFVKKSFSIEKQKKKFAKFLDKNDMGLTMYQANENFNEWEKVNKSGNTTPCN